MSDRSPEELAAMGANAQGSSDGPSNRADPAGDGGASKGPEAASAPPEADATPESRPAPMAQENTRGSRRRKRKADRGRRIAALVEAARSAPADDAKREVQEAREPAAAPTAKDAPALEDVSSDGGVAQAEAAPPDDLETVSVRGAGGEPPVVSPYAGEETETTEDAVEAMPPGDGEVMPFTDDAVDGDLEAAGVEELDIDDAEEVTAVGGEEEDKPLLPSPLPEAPANWYETIFDDDYMRVLSPPDAEQFERELRFYIESLAVAPGARILDVGCGSGAHAVELQARGFDVVGLDSSMPLLMRAMEEAQRRGLGPSFVHGDMRALALEGEFDGVLCVHDTFGYFDDASNFDVITTLYRSIRQGGRLLLGVPNRDYFVGDLPARICWEAEGCMVLDEVDFDFLRGRLEVKRSIATEDGRQVEHRYSIRTYALHELAQLVEQAGFRVVSVSGHVATRDTFLGPYSGSILLVAQRP